MTDHRSNGDLAGAQVTTEAGSVTEILPSECVLIVGGGPVGMLVATNLAFYGVRSVLLERNHSTTKWPKMDFTNHRSMEMMRKIGLAEELRKQGVPSNVVNEHFFSSGMGQKGVLAKWTSPTVDEEREHWREVNDGTLPLEPGLRISQVTFEAWIKTRCEHDPLTDLRFGWKMESARETDTGVQVEAVEVDSGKKRTIMAKYAVGCDGASSRMRKLLDIPVIGGPMPIYNLLVHFRSNDLERLEKFGRFYHHFFFNEMGLMGAIIAQDKPDIFTAHLMLPLEVDSNLIDSHEAVYRVLGASGEPYPIKIDEILVRSTYSPTIAVASHYAGSKRHIFLAGDAAHQNLPTGGYGMNMGLIDAFNIGWKLAAVVKGYGGPSLLESYEQERRPVALMSVEQSGVHMGIHTGVKDIIGSDGAFLNSENEKGVDLRRRIEEKYQDDSEQTSFGVTLGYTYQSDVVFPDPDTPMPEFTPARYIPSTYPGHRPPHVYLKSGQAIYDLYGDGFTLVDFTQLYHDGGAAHLTSAASDLLIPFKHLQLPDEDHVARLWEKPLVLIRPDGHVSWRGSSVESKQVGRDIMSVAAGVISAASLRVNRSATDS